MNVPKMVIFSEEFSAAQKKLYLFLWRNLRKSSRYYVQLSEELLSLKSWIASRDRAHLHPSVPPVLWTPSGQGLGSGEAKCQEACEGMCETHPYISTILDFLSTAISRCTCRPHQTSGFLLKLSLWRVGTLLPKATGNWYLLCNTRRTDHRTVSSMPTF
jgi:hypothetical protein